MENDMTPGSEGTELVEAAQAAKKEPKLFPKKKLPGLLKKTYSERALRRKILKAMTIPQDREALEGLFERGANAKKPNAFAVPAERQFTKKELSYYKRLVADIKSRKGRFMLLPLLAVVACIAAVVLVVGIFKNRIVKTALVAAGQAAFGAKTEVASVNLKIMDASLTVRGIAVGNKNSVMKNLFEVDTLALDFNLVQALRGRFDAQRVEVSGILFNTDRSTSCELPGTNAEEEKKKLSETEFMQSLKGKSDKALDDLKTQAADMLGGTDVESIVANIQAQLRSPETAKAAVGQVEDLVSKWKDKPDEVKSQVEVFSASIKDLQSIDVSKISDVQALQDALSKVNAAVEQSKTIKASAEALKSDILGDSNAVKTLTETVAAAVLADKELAESRLATVVNAVKNARTLLTNALDTVAYDMIGKYYPYAKQAVDYAQLLKTNAYVQTAADIASKQAEKSQKAKKERYKRPAGTTYWFTRDYPAFLIERALVSGENFSAEIDEITNDQNVRGKTTSLKGSLLTGEISHLADAVLDIRSDSASPLITMNYNGNGFAAAVDGTKIATTSGVPSVLGKAVLSLSASAGVDQFAASGKVDLDPVELTTDGFVSEIVTKYYRQALDTVKKMDIGYDFGYTALDGVNLDLDGNFADTFAAALKSVIESLGNDAKDEALKRINEQINGLDNEYLAKAKEFLGLEGDIDVQNLRLDDLQKTLDSKRAELEQRIQQKVEEETNKATQKAKEEVGSKIQDALGDSEAGKAASDAADKVLDTVSSGLLNGLKKRGN